MKHIWLFLLWLFSFTALALEPHDIRVRVFYYDDPMDIPANAHEGKLIFGGWAKWDGMGSCIVWTPRPIGIDDPKSHETLGHEIRHCIEGAFHPPYKSENKP